LNRYKSDPNWLTKPGAHISANCSTEIRPRSRVTGRTNSAAKTQTADVSTSNKKTNEAAVVENKSATVTKPTPAKTQQATTVSADTQAKPLVGASKKDCRKYGTEPYCSDGYQRAQHSG
jgi:hypothetical protein